MDGDVRVSHPFMSINLKRNGRDSVEILILQRLGAYQSAKRSLLQFILFPDRDAQDQDLATEIPFKSQTCVLGALGLFPTEENGSAFASRLIDFIL